MIDRKGGSEVAEIVNGLACRLLNRQYWVGG